jgi:mannose-6-phosphate isomerase-like protein (cupin superfamily)
MSQLPGGFGIDIEKETIENTDYRRVLHTGDNEQLVLMSINPLDDIPMEVHPTTDQFIRFEAGEGEVRLGNKVDPRTGKVLNMVHYKVKDGSSVDIDAGTHHRVVNISATEPLKLYTVYAPPEHPDGLVQEVKPLPGAEEEPNVRRVGKSRVSSTLKPTMKYKSRRDYNKALIAVLLL